MEPNPPPDPYVAGAVLLVRLGFDGRFLHASPQGPSLLGVDATLLVGRSAYEFVHPGDLDFLQFSHNIVLSDPHVHVITCRMRRHDGTMVWVEATARAVRDPHTGVLDHVLASLRPAPPGGARRSLTTTTPGSGSTVRVHGALRPVLRSDDVA